MPEEDDWLEPAESPSKSERKREQRALQAQVEALLELPDNLRTSLRASELFLSELAVAARMKPSSARNRMVRRLSRLADEDADTKAALSELLAREEERRALEKSRHHLLESWRERLIEAGDRELSAFKESYPASDHQRIRQLLRQYGASTDEARRKRLFREIYRALQEAVASGD